MVRHTVYCDMIGAPGSVVELEKNDRDHLFKVFRASIGDEVELLDGRGRRGIAHVIEGKLLSLESVEDIPEPGRKYHLYCAVAKRNKFEPLLKQCAELGVWSIVPVKFTRSVSDSDKSGGRWKVLLQEGCKQSKNPFVPIIREPVSLDTALEEMKDFHAFYGGIGEVSENLPDTGKDAAFLVGPEGGFTPEELEKIKNSGLRTLNLGPYVLRLETAAVCGMAVLRRILPLLLIVFLFCGCGKPATMKHPLMQKGTQYRNEGNYKLALEFYRNCLKKHPDSPDVILALAELYDENLDQPIPALFYYDEYLKNPPPGVDTTLAKNSRELVYARLGRQFERSSTAVVKLKQEKAVLSRQNELLRRYVRQLQNSLRTALAAKKEQPQKQAKQSKQTKQPAAKKPVKSVKKQPSAKQ